MSEEQLDIKQLGREMVTEAERTDDQRLEFLKRVSEPLSRLRRAAGLPDVVPASSNGRARE